MNGARRTSSSAALRVLLAAMMLAAASRSSAQPSSATGAVAPDQQPLPASGTVAPEEQPSPAPEAVAADAQPAGAAHADPALSTPDVVVQSLGGGEEKIQLVDHGDTWSLHAENVLAQDIFRLWHEAGGPEVVMKAPLDFPFTLSVHRMTTERIVERILEGWGHTLHFDTKGRLEKVRSYSPKPARMYKTPRLVESLGTWRQVETAKATLPGGVAEGAAAPVTIVAPANTPASPVHPSPMPVPEPVDDPMAEDPAE